MFKNKLVSILKKPAAAILLSVLLGFIIGAIVLLAAGYSPVSAYAALFKGIFGKPRYVMQTVIYATPVIITGLSVVFAFKTGLFNIGAEGQFMMGAIAASFLGYTLHLPSFIHPIVVIAGAMLAGALYGGLAGFLKARFGIHEVLSSIMLNWVALYFNNLYVTISWLKKPGTEAVYEIQPTAYINVLHSYKTSEEGAAALNKIPWLSDILMRTDINYGIIIAIVCAIAVWFILNKTTLGYSLKSVGANKDAAEFAGINVKKNIFVSMAIAGAIAGLAGAVYMTGMSPHRITTLAVHENFGFNGLSVALIANINPIGCIFAGLLFGGLKYGSGFIQSEMGAPSEIINIMIGTIVFFISIKTIFAIIAEKFLKGGSKQ